MPVGAPSFAEALRAGAEIFHALRGILKKRGHRDRRRRRRRLRAEPEVEPRSGRARARSRRQAGYKAGEDVFLALDVASSEFWDERRDSYVFKKSGERTRTSDEMVALYEDWVRQYPIISIEDGLAEGDWDGWKRLTQRARRPRAARRRRRVRHQPGDPAARHRREGRQRAAGQAESDRHGHRDARRRSRWRATAGYASVISHRSGETEDTTIADLAVGTARRPDQDRLGQPHRSRRANTTSCCASKRSSASPPRYAGHAPRVKQLGRPVTPCIDVVLLRHGESTWNKENRFTGWTDVDLSEQGPRGSARRRAAAEGRRLRLRPRLHVGAEARDPHAAGSRSTSSICCGFRSIKRLAAERAPLRRAAGAEQGGDRGEARRGAGQDLAPQLRHPAAAARRRTTRAIRRTIRATRASTPSELPLTESLKDTVARFLPVLARDDRAGDSARASAC